MTLTEKHLEYCITDRQREVISCIIKEGSNRKAAKVLGINFSVVAEIASKVRKRAQKHGYSPEHELTNGLMPIEQFKGRARLVDKRTGETILQWEKSSLDLDELQKVALAMLQAYEREIRPCQEIMLSHTRKLHEDLMSAYILTDLHIGMLAWHKETGNDDWDLKIAEDLINKWFNLATQLTPDSTYGLLVQLGDFLHYDGDKPLTPESRHNLSADSRYPNMVDVGVRVLINGLDMLLKKHQIVYVIIAKANHDPFGSRKDVSWLRAYMANNPRVIVIPSPEEYYCIEHGQTSLFFHHGHKRRGRNLDEVLAGRFREIYGRTRHSYAHTGHLHSDAVVETPLMKIEQHRTLAAPDDYAASSGYISGRDAKVITYHKQYGEQTRTTISVDMIRGESED